MNPAAVLILALAGGTVYPDPASPPIRDGVVLIEGGKITAAGPRAGVRVPPGARVLDCSGMTVTAGFWNSHVHFMERKWQDAARIPAPELAAQLEAMLTRYGFTSVFDTGSPFENTRAIRARVESGQVAGPRIRTTGEIVLPKGGAFLKPVVMAMGGMLWDAPEVSDAQQASAVANKLLDEGVDGIKIYAATWLPPVLTIPPDAVKALVAAAHGRGKPALAHPSNRQGLENSVDAGVDVLVHTAPQAGIWDTALLARMKSKRIAVIPTLKLWKYELRHDRDSVAAEFLQAGIAQLRAWNGAGGEVLFGTDVGYMGDYDTRDEYAFMREAGMSFRQILAALTTAPAARFGDAARLGRIAPGYTADITVFRGEDFANVAYTLRDGRVIAGYRRGRVPGANTL
ncbi:MAG: amidohydrolase family protein [Acidobacteriota bacterium]